MPQNLLSTNNSNNLSENLNTVTKDPHSYAEPDKVTVAELALELHPSFETRQIQGVAELTLDWHDKHANELILDTKKLNIQKIELLNPEGSWDPASFQLDAEDAILGAALHINASALNKKVKISYQTSPNADGLQWLEPSQTATKQYPYLYSHSEPIGARTWVPLQDTPAVRFTYKATIHTPKPLRAVMSANNDPDHPLNAKFEFTMPQKIPSYLVAFAIGHIKAQKTGPRSAVFSEPTIVDAAAKEFEDTEKMIQTAERLYGPYRWDNYDILVLPPAFPMGGMENPRLTFATPTVIAGDKSLISLVAHELAHSWSGNLVTNAAWQHIWLNEGFTTYVASRIVEEIYGKEQADQEFIVDTLSLKKEIEDLPPADQRMVPDLEGRDPHDGFSDVAYIKGAWFLRTLEEKFGREVFDNFLQQYFDNFAFESNTTDKFADFLQSQLLNKYPNKYSTAQVNQWLHEPGIPEDAAPVYSEGLTVIDKHREQWLKGEIASVDLQAKLWTSNQWQYFLDRLPEKISYEQAKSLDDIYHLTGTGNHVVAAKWYKLAIGSEYHDINDKLKEHLLTIGRRILVAPLYEALLKTEEGQHFAQAIYRQARSSYHTITRAAIDKKFAEKNVEIQDDATLKVAAQDNNRALSNLQTANLSHFKPAQKVQDIQAVPATNTFRKP